jgi:hypothetical protein
MGAVMHTSLSRALPLLVASVLGCEGLADEAASIAVDQCQTALGPATVDKGTWTLSGNGDRYDCNDARFNTNDLRLTAGPLGFAQDAAGELTLAVKPSLPADVTISLSKAKVTGSCVGFTVIEDDTRPSGPGLVSYHFDGTIGADGNMNGTFSFDGPASCRGDGRFIGRPSTL